MAKIKLKSKLNKSAKSEWEIVDGSIMQNGGEIDLQKTNQDANNYLKNWYSERIPFLYPDKKFEENKNYENVISIPELQETKKHDDATAYFNSLKPNKIFYNNSIDKSRVKDSMVHENKHRYDYYLPEYFKKDSEYLKKITPDLLINRKDFTELPEEKKKNVEPIVKEITKAKKYLTSPEEVTARIQKWRYENKISPTEVITKEKYKTLQKPADLDVFYNEDQIIDMLNKLSENKLEDVQPNKAKYGTSISQQGYRDDSGVKVGKSKIEGKGLLTNKQFGLNDIIGLSHIDDQPVGDIGNYHNHSDKPNAKSIKIGNQRFLIPIRPLKKGEEITTDYRQQPELEQPENFGKSGKERVMQDGGNFKNYNWKENREYKNNPANLNSRGGLDVGVSKNLPFGFNSSAGVGFDEDKVNYRAGLGYNNKGLDVNTDYNSSGRLNANVNYDSPVGLNAGFKYSNNKGEKTYSGNLGYSSEKIPVGLNTGYTHTSEGHNANADLNFNTKNINGNFGYEYNQGNNNHSFNAGVNIPFLSGMGNVDINSNYNLGDKQPSVNVGGTFKFENGGFFPIMKDGGQYLTVDGEYHRVYRNAEGDIMVNHPKEDKGKWDTINLTDKSDANTIAEGVASVKKWHKENPYAFGGNVMLERYEAGGELIKRADGSYSKRGLWDNIRENAGSGKKPTKEMLKQEKKIKASEKKANGGSIGEWEILEDTPIMQTGGRKPLEISDPREFKIRQQAYQDSTDLYNYSQLQKKVEPKSNSSILNAINNRLWNPNGSNYVKSHFDELRQEQISDIKNNNYNQDRKDNKYKPLWNLGDSLVLNNPNIIYTNEYDSPDIAHKTIKPISTYYGDAGNDVYQKPVEPVVYKPTILDATLPASISTVTPSTTSTYESLEPLRPKQTSIELPQLNTQISQEQQQLEFNNIPFKKGSYFTVDREGQQSGGAGFSDRRTQMTDYYDNKTGKKLGAYPKKELGGNIETESEWEILPEAKDGKKIKPKYEWSNQQTTTPSITVQGNNNVSRTEGNRKLTKQETEQLRLYNEIQNQLNKEREYNQRKQNIQQSIEAQGQPLSTENLKTQTQATGDKLSFAMNTPYGNPNQYPVASQYINALDEINPFKMVGDMASGLGSAPQDVKEGNYLKAAMSVTTPLAAGALAGMGTQGTKQFVNELVNPFAGMSVKNLTSLKNTFSDNALGITKGVEDLVKGRPFFETFPITNNQKAKIIQKQNESFKEGLDFTKKWYYPDDITMRPEVKSRIIALEPNIENVDKSRYLTGLYDGNPLFNVKNKLIKEGDEQFSSLSKEAQQYIIENKGKIAGVNMGDESITLRNHGVYYYPPEEIGNTAAHELAHSAQELGSLSFKGKNMGIGFPWGDQTTKYYPETSYFSSNRSTEIGNRFKDALKQAKKSKDGVYKYDTWLSSPNELHSELSSARLNFAKKYNLKPKDMQDLSDNQISKLINDFNLNKHFKKQTPLKEKIELVKLLPAIGGIGAFNLNQTEQKQSGGKVNTDWVIIKD